MKKMQPELLAIGERAIQVTETWTQAYTAIQGVGITPDATTGQIPGMTLAEINSRTVAALASVATLRGAEPAGLELIAHRLPACKSAIDTIETHAGAIVRALEPLQGASASNRNGNLNLQLQHPEKGAQNFDLGSPLTNIAQQVSALLDQLPYVAYSAGKEGAHIFAGLARNAEASVGQLKGAAEQAAKELAAAKTAVAELSKLTEAGAQLSKQLQELVTNATSQKAAIDANAAEVEQKLARVREVSKDADTLHQRVTGFSSQFEAFEAQMKARLDQFSAFEAATKEAERINGERETRIDGLIDKADTMIRGATTAGLSKSLDDAKGLYETRLQEAQKYFLLSAAALLVCTLPIAAQLIPGPWQQYFTPQSSAATGEAAVWLSALGKLILVIPATWATAFFATNYAELFHLSREYAHKAALAKAIDGFKREAPEYAQEIVGSVFMEIQDNPGSRKAPSAARPENPVTKKFLEKVLEAIKLVKSKD